MNKLTKVKTRRSGEGNPASKIEMTDAQILATARIDSSQADALDRSELAMTEIVIGVAKLAGKQLHLVTWPNGVAILVHADPNNKTAWEALIAKSYRAAVMGYRGAVTVKGAK